MSESDLDLDDLDKSDEMLAEEEALAEPDAASATPRREVSASTIAHMMGVATKTEIELLEGKIDLLNSKLHTVSLRLEKIAASFQKMPTGSDLERIDVQLGSLKTFIREAVQELAGKELSISEASSTTEERQGQSAETEILEDCEDDDEALKPRIFSNQGEKAEAEQN